MEGKERFGGSYLQKNRTVDLGHTGLLVGSIHWFDLFMEFVYIRENM